LFEKDGGKIAKFIDYIIIYELEVARFEGWKVENDRNLIINPNL